ncbi:MAG: FAD-binding protein [Gammaproteobacteria bacterium]|nr:FAD-binding protein [Gammaproteobacteria bacterium]
MPLQPHLVQRFVDACGEQSVLADQSECWTYGFDNSKQHACPDLVVLPQDAKQIQECVQLCRQFNIPLTTRGRGTNTTGAAVPVQSGIVLSTERMDRILEVDRSNRNMRVEPGVLNSTVQKRAAEVGLFWPPDPGSADYCTVGGNLACNAAGPRAIKYGTCRENTLEILAVTGAGHLIRTGSATTKGVVGLDLTRLLIGSEGILAIITEARLKLGAIAERTDTIRACYQDTQSAIDAVVSILAQSALPCALEFIDEGSLNLIRGQETIALDSDAKAMLIIEVDGLTPAVDADVAAVLEAAKNPGCVDLKNASESRQREELWRARKVLSQALRSFAPSKINEDVVVPVSQLPALLLDLERLSKEFSIPIFNFGHAGNGNIHVNLLYDESDSRQAAAARQCLNKVFDLVLKLGGTLSGEHGVGVSKRDWVDRELNPEVLSLMMKIKQQFDPDGILNPGKVLPNLAVSD